MQEMENEMKHFIFLFVRIRICKEAKIKGKENAQRTNPHKNDVSLNECQLEN